MTKTGAPTCSNMYIARCSCTSYFLQDGLCHLGHGSDTSGDLTARLSWINWDNLGVNPNRRGFLGAMPLTTDNIGT